MREAAAIAAGSLVALAVLALAAGTRLPGRRRAAAGWQASLRIAPAVASWRASAAITLERAGWREPPHHLFAAVALVVILMSAAAYAIEPWLAPAGAAAGCAAVGLWVGAAVERRRRVLMGELVPLLELFTLELSAGGSALGALGSVTVQVESELAADIRGLLIASQVSGSLSFESRLLEYAGRIRMPALATLATILAASRDFGTGATQGARALATDLRRAQRRELIARSRKALNHVLLPAAIGVLLPFLGVLMFPAVSVLQRSLR